MERPPLIVFTDLDGTLLDHADYGHQAADAWLAALAEAGVPVVLATSKTAAEIAPLRAELGFAHVPAICENGAGIVPPGHGVPDGAGRYLDLRGTLAALPEGLRGGFEGFGDMGDDRVAEVTGLSPVAASLARARDHSEPGLWHGTDADRTEFIRRLQAEGVTAREGGRFLTLSFGGTKADRMEEIAAHYGQPPSVALGDAPNDREMIEAATRGVIVANPHGAPLPRLPGEDGGGIIRTARPGPEGWAEAMDRLAPEYGLTA